MRHLLLAILSTLLAPIGWLLKKLLANTNPDQNLDKTLDKFDAKIAPELRRFPAAPDSPPRRSFRSGLPFAEHHFSRITLERIARLIKIMPRLMHQMNRGSNYYTRAFEPERPTADEAFFEELEALAKKHGALGIGYVRQIPADDIFAGKALPHPHAIVFTIEMDRDIIQSSPSFESFEEVASGYLRLALVANTLTAFLRERGFAAYPGTALGGTTDYVRLGEAAGLGASGYHGLLITPEAGASVRLSTIYTNIENLPQRHAPDTHRWVRDFCSQCKQCVRSCPAGAINPQPVPAPNGHMISIDYDSCIDYFAGNYGCAVCISVCPFTGAGYEAIEHNFTPATHTPPPAHHKGPRVAIVGAGAAGFYATQALLDGRPDVRVDIFERLFAPYGLVRFGVAPDHPQVRAKSWTFDSLLEDPRVSLRAGVTLGEQLQTEALLEAYDAVIYATGARRSKRLGIPGESLQGSYAAADFIGWYNSHPEHAALAPNLSDVHSAVIVGMGNVALDVARQLLVDPAQIAHTDMASYALDALARAHITDVHILGRRGPDAMSFTPREFRDVLELKGVALIIHGAPLDTESDDENIALIEAFRAKTHHVPKRLHLHFYTSSTQVLASPSGERVAGVEVHTARGTETLDTQLFITSIGYRSDPLPSVPFDEARGVIPCDEVGRVMRPLTQQACKEYVTGWVRRGAQGVVGTNRVDAQEVVAALLDDLEDVHIEADRTELDLDGVILDESDWFLVAREERRRGSRAKKRAERFTDADDVCALLDTTRGDLRRLR